MKLTTLLENTACGPELRADHGLSLYLETPRHRVLFDMGPNGDFAVNAAALGIDLRQADVAILSHGHYDHGGGLRTFLTLNDHTPVCIHEGAFAEHFARTHSGGLRDIGLDPALRDFRDRFAVTRGITRIDDELLLFDGAEDTGNFMAASASLLERGADGELRADTFDHEQNLLVTAEGKSVVIAGCAHRGVVAIRDRAAALLGRAPDVVVGGFHLFELPAGDPAADALIDRTGAALAEGETIYYTGHCTGEYALSRLKGILGGRLHRFCGGESAEL